MRLIEALRAIERDGHLCNMEPECQALEAEELFDFMRSRRLIAGRFGDWRLTDKGRKRMERGQ